MVAHPPNKGLLVAQAVHGRPWRGDKALEFLRFVHPCSSSRAHVHILQPVATGVQSLPEVINYKDSLLREPSPFCCHSRNAGKSYALTLMIL